MALLLRASKVADGKADILVDSGQIIIGRLPSNNLVLPGPGVESIHAMVEIDSQTGIGSIIDMTSESGVKLNGKIIEVVEVIKPGDKIEIGSIYIDVLDPSQEIFTPEEDSGNNYAEDGDKTAKFTPPPPIPEKPLPKANIPLPDLKKTTVRLSQKAADTEEDKGQKRRTAHINTNELFKPGKERPSGATLEVVVFWEQNIIDIRHYGDTPDENSAPIPKDIYIGNEEDGHMFGVGPSSDTRNLKIAEVRGGKTVIFLDKDMKGRVRKGGQFEKVVGPKDITLASKEVALIKHGPLDYFFMNVSIPNPLLKKYEDLEGRPIIFVFAGIVYLVLSMLLLFTGPSDRSKKIAEQDKPWEIIMPAVRTPTPRPTVLPLAKPPVPIPTVATTPKPEPTKKPEPIKKPVATPPPPKDTPRPQPVPTPKKVVQAPPKPAPVVAKIAPAPKVDNKKNKDTAAGTKVANKPKDNSGGATGGTTGNMASARQGKEDKNLLGQQNEKKNLFGAVNFDKLGGATPKTSDIDAIASINIGKSSNGGSVGGGAGTEKRGAWGLGGANKGTNSMSAGGVGGSLAIGGGHGADASGGLGGAGGTGSGSMSGKMRSAQVQVPEDDIVTMGSLSKEEIEAVIRANLNKIRACYERNLQGNRNLQGRVSMFFIIGGDGHVQSARVKETTLNHSGTQGCISDEIKRWKFPTPKGGGVVNVTYPFVFTSAGG